MKTRRVFKSSRFLLVELVVVVLAEVGAAWISRAFGLQNNPLLVGVLAMGVVAFAASVIYQGCDFE